MKPEEIDLAHKTNKGRGKCSAHSRGPRRVPGTVLLRVFPTFVSIIQEYSMCYKSATSCVNRCPNWKRHVSIACRASLPKLQSMWLNPVGVMWVPTHCTFHVSWTVTENASFRLPGDSGSGHPPKSRSGKTDSRSVNIVLRGVSVMSFSWRSELFLFQFPLMTYLHAVRKGCAYSDPRLRHQEGQHWSETLEAMTLSTGSCHNVYY